MTYRQTRRFEMFVRVVKFGEFHREAFPVSSPGGRAFEALGGAVTQLDEQGKVATVSASRRKKNAARGDLLAQLELVGRWAGLAARNGAPGFNEPFTLPRSRSHSALLAAGQRVVTEGTRSESQLIGVGMPKDVLAELTRLVDDYGKAVENWEAVRNETAAVRASIDEAFAMAAAELERLEMIVATEYRFDPVTMARWEQARKIEYASKRRSKLEVSPVEPMKEVA